ncbi:fasciclin domain-containing protein [Colletotrichum orchidophilum]|uniref:Fasciclin domain-containing protein n=1 Tax=Colletotrichum orchidophilum TaxID=1209926 RepID=A0A1G4BP56_9PEZI|nr:fasciclin domain-containing protein [Colletotrichum orchidophilum]OHF03250.1 fasciclin domain-containing protein [Colletotrichum orchidophilum]
MGRRIQICFHPSTSLRRILSDKLIRHVHSSSLPLQTTLRPDTEDLEVMKSGHLLPFAAAAASALALPDSIPEQSTLRIQNVSWKNSDWDKVRTWGDDRSSLGEVVGAVGGIFSQAAGAMARAGRRVMGHAHDAEDIETALVVPALQHTTEDDLKPIQEDGNGGVSDKEGKSLLTVIKESSIQAEYFTTLLDSYDKVREMLVGNNKQGQAEHLQFTVFVPTDEAFRKLEGFERSRAELLGEILEYHVLPGRYTAEDLRGMRTAPTVLEQGGELGEAVVGGDRRRRQRVRIADGPGGVEVNFYGMVLASESRESRNGVVHFIDNVLIAPPRHDVLVDALPEDRLGNFSRAMRRSGLSEELYRWRAVAAEGEEPGRGLTVFAPSNDAWAKLGEEALEFFFSSRDGEAFLKALVRYHFVAEVLYTDSFDVEQEEKKMKKKQKGKEGNEGGEDDMGVGRVRREVRTLLDGARVSVSISVGAATTATGGRPPLLGGTAAAAEVRVNGAVVSTRDVPVRDGVVHILDEVLLPSPPSPSSPLSKETDITAKKSSGGGARIGVGELKRRLVRFVEAGEGARDEEL